MKTVRSRSALGVSVFVIVGLLLLTQVAGAAPQAQQIEAPSQTLISYQGTLTDENGSPINATVTMKFALYDAGSGGNLKWGTESQNVVVTDGLFHVRLGSVLPVNPAALTGDLWLNIIVNNEQLAPRELLTSVPYAVEAGTLPPDAATRGSLQVNGNLFQVVGQNWMGRIDQVRTDEQGREHRWTFWHMNQEYGMNSFQLYEYRKDSSGVACGGNPDDGAICAQRLKIDSGGNMCIGCGEGGDLTVNGNGDFIGSGTFGGATFREGAMNLQSIAVPLTFRESDGSGAGSLWRMPLDGTNLRFDSSDNGTDFSAFHTALTMYPNGTVGCGAITENNLQTEKERAAGGSDRFEEGDVLCWGIDQLEKCTAANDRLVQAVADSNGRPIVIGAEVVKVLGPVKRGDILVASSVPGYAMVNNDPVSGSVIAQALEDLDGKQGIIKAMIRKW